MFYNILEWAEVWALFIPIAALLKNKNQPKELQPVVIYVFIALLINTFADTIFKLKYLLNLPSYFHSNLFLYNIHAIIRFFLFSLFFILLPQYWIFTLKRILPFLFLVFVVINFQYEPFNNIWYARDGELKGMISYRLFAVEAALLLFYCLQYYFYNLKYDVLNMHKTSAFWFVTGLSFFVVVNFFYYLFYQLLLQGHGAALVDTIWTYSNITYIILCCFIAKAFYVHRNQ